MKFKGKSKPALIEKTASKEFDIVLSCELEATRLIQKQDAIAIDVGVEKFAIFSNKEVVKNPRFFKQGKMKLALAQTKLCKHETGTKERNDFSHNVEKSINDISWNQFRQILSYKEAEAGRSVGVVIPSYTSQACSNCGYLEPLKLKGQRHIDKACGYSVCRNENAAKKILTLGMDALGKPSGKPSPLGEGAFTEMRINAPPL